MLYWVFCLRWRTQKEKKFQKPYKPETISQRIKCQEYTKVTPKRIVVVIHLDLCSLWLLIVNHLTVKNPRNVWPKCALSVLAIVVQVARGLLLGWQVHGKNIAWELDIYFFFFFYPAILHSWLQNIRDNVITLFNVTAPPGFLIFFRFSFIFLLIRWFYRYDKCTNVFLPSVKLNYRNHVGEFHTNYISYMNNASDVPILKLDCNTYSLFTYEFLKYEKNNETIVTKAFALKKS